MSDPWGIFYRAKANSLSEKQTAAMEEQVTQLAAQVRALDAQTEIAERQTAIAEEQSASTRELAAAARQQTEIAAQLEAGSRTAQRQAAIISALSIGLAFASLIVAVLAIVLDRG